MAEMKATPRNGTWGLIADAMGEAVDFLGTSTNPIEDTGADYSIPGFVADTLRPVANTADRISYGERLTDGTGFARQLKPDTRDTLIEGMGLVGSSMTSASKLVAEYGPDTAQFVAKQIGPKMAEMVEDYLTNIGAIKHVYLDPRKKANKELIGNRYEHVNTKDVVPGRKADISELKDFVIVSPQYDLSRVAQAAKSISDEEIDLELLQAKYGVDATMPGGFLFGAVRENYEKGLAGANMGSAATNMRNTLNSAQRLSDSRGGKGVLYAPQGMNFDSYAFSGQASPYFTGLFNNLSKADKNDYRKVLANGIRPEKKEHQALADKVKELILSKEFEDDPFLLSADPEKIGATRGVLSKMFYKSATAEPSQVALGFNVADLNNAINQDIFNTSLIESPKGLIGSAIYPVRTSNSIASNVYDHPAYSDSILRGDGGDLFEGASYLDIGLTPIELLYGRKYDDLYNALMRPKPVKADPSKTYSASPATARNQAINSLHNFSDERGLIYVDDEVIERVRAYKGL